MNAQTIKQLSRHFRQFQFVRRNDSQARGQFRVLFLGIICCLVLYYVADSLLIAPQKTALNAALARKMEVSALGGGQQLAGLGPRIVQLQQKKLAIGEDIAILALREKLQRQHWQFLGDPIRFNNIIFTMTPTAPINVDGKLLQMNLGEKRSFAIYDEQPIVLSGKGKYLDVLTYLHYLEVSPEIGSIDNLAINGMAGSGSGIGDLVHFSLLVSRVLLKEKQ